MEDKYTEASNEAPVYFSFIFYLSAYHVLAETFPSDSTWAFCVCQNKLLNDPKKCIKVSILSKYKTCMKLKNFYYFFCVKVSIMS